MRTHVRTHGRTHVRTHGRTHVRTPFGTLVWHHCQELEGKVAAIASIYADTLSTYYGRYKIKFVLHHYLPKKFTRLPHSSCSFEIVAI